MIPPRACCLLLAVCAAACPVAEDPGSKAIRSPVVFHGKLLSLSQEGPKATAVFRVQKVWKGSVHHKMLRRDPVSVEFETSASAKCSQSVRDLQTEQRYFVFATSGVGKRTAFRAVAPATEFTRRASRLVRKAICPGCAKPPTVRGLGDSQVEIRKRLRLKCKLSGNPAPQVDWYRDGKKLRAKGRVKIRTKRKYSKLEIGQVRLQDSGLYECRAVNVVAKHYAVAKARVRVIEKGEIRPPHPTNDSTLWPLQGQPCVINSFCLNGGTCSYYETVGEYVCQCAEGYRGQRCESKDIYTLGSMEGKHKSYRLLLSAVIVLAVLLFIICSSIGCYICCRHCLHLRRKVRREVRRHSAVEPDAVALMPSVVGQSKGSRSPVDPTPKFRHRLLASSSADYKATENRPEVTSEIAIKNSEQDDNTAEVVRLIQRAFRQYR